MTHPAAAVRVLWCDVRDGDRAAVVRSVLARELSRAPEDVEIVRGPWGRPELAGDTGGLHFSVASSGPRAVVGLGLTASLETLHVGAGSTVPDVRLAPPWPGGRWSARMLATASGLVAALAVEGPWRVVRQIRYANGPRLAPAAHE